MAKRRVRPASKASAIRAVLKDKPILGTQEIKTEVKKRWGIKVTDGSIYSEKNKIKNERENAGAPHVKKTLRRKGKRKGATNGGAPANWTNDDMRQVIAAAKFVEACGGYRQASTCLSRYGQVLTD